MADLFDRKKDEGVWALLTQEESKLSPHYNVTDVEGIHYISSSSLNLPLALTQQFILPFGVTALGVTATLNVSLYSLSPFVNKIQRSIDFLSFIGGHFRMI